MTYLVDANVLCEPTKLTPSPRVIAWLTQHEGALVVDAIILGEMYAGIVALPSGRKRHELDQWFTRVARSLECLPWDATVSLRWGRLVAELRQKGTAMPILDSMIAATALEHNLTVATRNVRDFQKAGVKIVDPFSA